MNGTRKSNGDIFKRREVSPGTYQCGCHWMDPRHPEFGDVLVQCELHQAATNARVEKFERDRKFDRMLKGDSA